MRRALQLARQGAGHTSPNPMVGAVIVGPDGTIIGEGWHRKCGEGHAEVNAVASVNDPSLLKDSTIYVTLEPCPAICAVVNTFPFLISAFLIISIVSF